MDEIGLLSLSLFNLAFFGYNAWRAHRLDTERKSLTETATKVVVDRAGELLEAGTRMNARYASAFSELAGSLTTHAPVEKSAPRSVSIATEEEVPRSIMPPLQKLVPVGRFAPPPEGSDQARIIDAMGVGAPTFPPAPRAESE